MDETRQFIFEILRNKRINIGHFVEYKWIWHATATASPIIQNNWKQVLENMLDDGLLEERTGHNSGAFLTQQEFNEVYNQ